MAGYLAQLHHAATAYGDRLGDTRLLPLAIALALHLLSLLVRSGVWCGILRAAFPERRVELRPTVWAYLAGVGANAVAPFRGGDIVRIYAMRRQLVDAPVATIVSTLVAETVFGVVVVCPTPGPSSSRSTPATFASSPSRSDCWRPASS
jgi:hypothetical protein